MTIFDDMQTTEDGIPLIDPRAHRGQLAGCALLFAVAGATKSPLPLVIGAVLFAVAALRYPSASVFALIVTRLWTRKRPPRLLIDARPSRAMCVLTAITMAVGAALVRRYTWMIPVCALMAAAYLIEALLGRCVTCESYRRLAASGLIHPSPPLTEACIVSAPTKATTR
jgi:hypothetical protein